MELTSTPKESFAIVIADTTINRGSHLLALEIDERLSDLRQNSRIFDMADRSYPMSQLIAFDNIILVGSHEGSLYSLEIHELLAEHRQVWRNKKVASIIDGSELIQASAADLQLKLALKNLGVHELEASLIVLNAKNKFDSFLNLMNIDLDNEIDRFIGALLKMSSTRHSFVLST
ncbi:hypothetical protein [Marinoscillum sp. MHG1-6]|uniref:hypothetical protein n=1 Tax=Marinoscillum sp. MHG1-6 TaxID=2959627 RepID=UPI002156FD43|nr:hypothetical protein [Marinoscillum sp. MHG1-6]